MWFTSSIQSSESSLPSLPSPCPSSFPFLLSSSKSMPVSMHGSRLLIASLTPAVHPPPPHCHAESSQSRPGSRNKPAKKRSKASPACNRTWSGPSYSFSSVSPSTKHISAQSSWLSHLTPGLQCSLFPQHWDSSCLFSCCFAARRGRRTITTAPNTSTKQREPYPGQRSAVHLWMASPTPFHSPCLDSRLCKQSHTILPTPLPPFLPENQLAFKRARIGSRAPRMGEI